MTPQHIHDVLIIGAGVSGATAGVLLAQHNLDVALVDARRFPDPVQQTACLSPHAVQILQQAGVACDEILSSPVRACTFYSADFTKTITPRLGSQTAYLVDRSRLVQSLLNVYASTERSLLREGTRIVHVDIGEEWATATSIEGDRVYGRLLLLATGGDTTLVDKSDLAAGLRDGTGLWMASYRCPAENPTSPARIDYVLGLGAGEGYGYRLCKDEALTVGVCVGASSNRAVSDLIRISKAFEARKLLRADWQSHAAGTRSVWSPAGLCLELESHVAKRTLTIGQVGGFVASYTNEGMYPGMWSAQLAAQVVREALQSKQPQDKLREYESVWRMTMAGYLRSPNTDAQSLLPLVFANQQMADKMLESLQLGTNF